MSRRALLKLALAGGLNAALGAVSLSAPAGLQSDWRFKLPPLPYAEDALEPYIDARTMRLHHGAHHAAYTDKLNSRP